MNSEASPSIPDPDGQLHLVNREDILARAEDRRNLCRIHPGAGTQRAHRPNSIRA